MPSCDIEELVSNKGRNVPGIPREVPGTSLAVSPSVAPVHKLGARSVSCPYAAEAALRPAWRSVQGDARNDSNNDAVHSQAL